MWIKALLAHGSESPVKSRRRTKIISFLEENGFIILDDDKKRAKISTLGLKFLELPPE